MEYSRNSGSLLAVSSLNGEFGIGTMGKSAKNFVDKLALMNFSYWQVLPLNPVDSSGSPYCSFSAFAGSVSLIDPTQLLDDGLITADELKENVYSGSIYITDYDFAYTQRIKTLKAAFARINDTIQAEIEVFAKTSSWVEDYAFFMALKQANELKAWWEWDEKFAIYESAQKFKADFQDEINFHIFTQYIFYKQYNALKQYANYKEIYIIGDMPIYVSRDSVDVWANVSQFQINKKSLQPIDVAGVPPDYFSADGQLWGNPLYDWDEMKKDEYSWWTNRLEFSLNLYDDVRIDHFRALASYWAVPYGSATAKEGVWKKGPAMDFFNAINKKIKEPAIIAEDLGTFGQDVVDLLEESGLAGMRVIQFGFDPGGDSCHLPHNYEKNTIAYVGTHDNNTILGWLWDAQEWERKFALRYCGFKGDNWGEGGYQSSSCRSIIEAVWKSSSKTAIIAVQDMCGYGKDARLNIPGTSDKNWIFRISADALSQIDVGYFNEINFIYKRTNKPERKTKT